MTRNIPKEILCIVLIGGGLGFIVGNGIAGDTHMVRNVAIGLAMVFSGFRFLPS